MKSRSRLLAGAAAGALVLMGCGSPATEGEAEIPTRLAAYDLATGDSSFVYEMKMDGTMGFGAAMRASMGQTDSSRFEGNQPVSLQVRMELTQTITEDASGRKVTVRVDDVEGHMKAFDAEQDLTRSMVVGSGGGELTYTLKPDGSTDLPGGNALGGMGAGLLGGSNIGLSCPRLLTGGAESGQEWQADQQMPLAGVDASVPAVNSLEIDGTEATITSRTDGPYDLSIDMSELAKSNPAITSAGAVTGMTMRVSGTSKTTTQCVLALPEQELVSSTTDGHMNLTTSLVGTPASPRQSALTEGELVHMDVDMASSIRAA